MTAPEFDRLLYIAGRDGLPAGEKVKKIINEIYDILSELKPCGDDEQHVLWFSLSRGTIDDYYDYEDMLYNEEVSSREEYETLYAEDYPESENWYLLRTSRYHEYTTFTINSKIFVRTTPEKSYEYEEVIEPLSELKMIVAKCVESVKEGTYNEWLESNLPHNYRFGTINCKQYWVYDPEKKEMDLDQLDEKTVLKFNQLAEKIEYNPKSLDNNECAPEKCLKTMTAQLYKECMSKIYRKLYSQETKNMTVEQMFQRYADDRNGGLDMIDQNDSEIFLEWYNVPSQDKWDKYTNPSHMWEAIQGSSRTRTHITPVLCDRGWFFVATSNLICNRQESVLVAIAMVEAGLPIKMWDALKLSKIISGDTNIGIIPCYLSAFDFAYGGFPAESVYEHVNLDKEGSELDKNISWIPLEKVEAI